MFLVTLALAMTLNFLIFYCISSMAFWIVEIGFLFEGMRIVIILLSGGIFPLEVFGERFVQITNLLPFKYTVSYPINVLNGKTRRRAKLRRGCSSSASGSRCVWSLANVSVARGQQALRGGGRLTCARFCSKSKNT